MTCSMCDFKKPLKRSKITHKYKECGLGNVTLIGVEHRRCDKCGEEYLGYGNVEKIHKMIAEVLIQKKDFLTGSEVRFLRKFLGYPTTKFAKIIGYDDATLSRLETGAHPITRAFDRLIRFAVAAKLPGRSFDLHDQILNGKGLKLNRIELTSMAHGGWKLKAV